MSDREPLELTWAGFSDVVRPSNIAGHREPHFVMHPCELVSKGYYCETHDLHLANIGNLVMHVEAGGRHHVVVWCSKHRMYEAPDAAQIEGFRRLSQPTLSLPGATP